MRGLRLGLGLVRSGSAFDPSSLFSASDKGVVFDFSSMASLYQSTDTSSPVSAAGQSIGRASDLSGKGNHATQATAANRPTWQTTYGSFDGTNDTLATANIDFSSGDKMTVIASVQTPSASQQIIVNIGGGAGSAGLSMTPGGNTRGQLNGSTGTSVVDTTGPTVGADAVTGALLDIGGSAATDEIKVRLNGALPTQTVALAGPAGGGNFGAAAPVNISSNTSAAYVSGRIYRIILINRILSGVELTNAERWCAGPTSVVI